MKKKLLRLFESRLRKKGLQDYFGDILVPSEEVVEIRRGAKVAVEKNYFPGYVLAKIDLNDESWHLVRNTPKVSGFLGAKGKPMPISEAEVNRIMKQVQDSAERPRHAIDFEIGEQIKVCDGPFSSFSGVVLGSG